MNDSRPPLLVQRGWFWLGVLALAGLIVGYEVYRKDRKPVVNEEFKTQRYIIPQPPVSEFTVKRVAELRDELDANELVLGVMVGKEARAYPLNMLNAEPQTKVLNDVVAGRAIGVTWCDRCRTGIVFDRVVDGQTLTLGVFGSLWRDSMVLYDQETMTQWSQWEGKAKMGPLRGASLQRLPSVVAVWEDWRRQYPDGSVVLLEQRQNEFGQGTYQDAAAYVLVVGEGAGAKTWSLADVAAQRVVNDHWQDKPVAAFFLEKSGTAQLFERQLGERTLTFRWEQGALKDDATGSVWDPLTGRASAGPLAGRQLTPLAGMVTSRSAWRYFHR